MTPVGKSCGCAAPVRNVQLEFDGGRVNLRCAECGEEVDVEPEDLYSDALPMTLTFKQDFDVDADERVAWYELAPRPPDAKPS